VQKEAVLSAKRSIVTVEEIVDSLDAWPNACVLPGWAVTAVCEVQRGAFPSYAHGYYDRDNRFYRQWDQVSRTRETFDAWVQKYIYGTKDFAEFLALQAAEGDAP
jgi:glutaconate CoA-transferase subunit A